MADTRDVGTFAEPATAEPSYAVADADSASEAGYDTELGAGDGSGRATGRT